MKAHIEHCISDALTRLGAAEVSFVVEHPSDVTYGDYATNVALAAAKQVEKPPREVAELLVTELEGKIAGVAAISIAGPGFINFTLDRAFFVSQIDAVLGSPEQWGCTGNEKNETVLIEYTSPNLFKPLHIGNLVGNIIGESLSRLFEMAGATVVRFNYPSDIGLTVAKGVWGLQKTGNNPDDILALGDAYRIGSEAYENDPVAKGEIDQLNKRIYEGTDSVAAELRERGIATSKARLYELLEVLGTTFDHEIYESEVSAPGSAIVREHLGDVFTESDGAVVFDGEKTGLHTRVFLNSLGLPTYEAKDLGNFVLKTERVPTWTRSLIVTGNEQAEYFKVLYAAIRALHPEFSERSLEHIPTGFLTLTTGKMSSRKGNVLTGESLLAEMEEAAHERAAQSRTDDLEKLTEQVAVAALKYQILRQSVGSNIVFNKEQALSFDGDSGPYLQYTYARICSVLEKAASSGVVPSYATAPEYTYAIERMLYQFPEVTADALIDRSPHKVVSYLTELASAFNSFYAHEKIADASDVYAPYKASLALAVGQTLKRGLWVLGIEAPERM